MIFCFTLVCVVLGLLCFRAPGAAVVEGEGEGAARDSLRLLTAAEMKVLLNMYNDLFGCWRG